MSSRSQEATTITYPGRELEPSRRARNWKRYFASMLQPHVRGDVLEVGAGIGNTTPFLLHAGVRSWQCIEPDPSMLDALDDAIDRLSVPTPVSRRAGTLQDLGDARFDTILYIDVLEHIADDGDELRRAAALLRPGGRCVVLAPAYQWLYSPFDRAVGHARRYDRSALEALVPDGSRVLQSWYMDINGILLSAMNRFLFRRAQLTRAHILFWDRFCIPLSRLLDRLFGYRAGKSVICVYEKGDAHA